jgi:hypothetical protein
MTVDRVAGTGLVLLGLLTLWESRVLPLGSLRSPGPAYMPVVLAVVVLGLGALIWAFGAGSPRLADVGWHEAGHALAILGTCAFTALALERLGYRVTMAVLILVLLRAVERQGMVFAAGFALGLSLATHYLFDTLLRVPLPRGPLGL